MKIAQAYSIIMLFFGIILFPKAIIAQEIEGPMDDLGNVSDAFQENFFEALKQKGIENYELAIVALEKAEKLAKDDAHALAVVNFELGKNQTKLKKYEEAEENFNKVILTQGDRLDVMEALYGLYFNQRNYEAAIPLVQKLIKIDDDYKEDLANLYSRTERFDEAIKMLDELDESFGESDYRDALRTQIYRKTGNSTGQIEKLEQKIDNNPKNEQDYLNLIYLYSEEGNIAKAFETAKELLKNNPKSELVHLALYKYYLEDGATDDAIKSMKKAFASSQVDKPNKYKVLGDFIQFVNLNPEYEEDLSEMIGLFADENDGGVYEKLGGYYVSKGLNEEALKLYEQGIDKDQNNFSLLKNTILLKIVLKKFDKASTLSSNALEIFPAQSFIYLLNGVANNCLQKSDLAIESLEAGVDYLLDDALQERDFYKQLSIAYTQKGNMEKANLYTKKALEIKDPN